MDLPMNNTRILYFCGHEQFQPEVLVKHAALAEEVGFDGVMVSDHFHPWVDDVGTAGFAFSTLAAIAHATNRLQLVIGVTAPLFRYHPAVVAQASATIDRLSGGRFELGIGTGENINEGPLGFNFGDYKERTARINEAVQIIRALLAGQRLSFSGKYYQTDRARLYSPPLHPIPIWMAAGNRKSAARAARLTDGIITSVRSPSDTMSKVVTPARESAATAGLPPPPIIFTRWCVFAKNDDDAWTSLLPWRGLRVPGRLSATDPLELRKVADSMPRDDITSLFARTTHPKEIVDLYKPLIVDLGAHTIVIQVTSVAQEETIRMIGDEVLPKLRTEPGVNTEPS